MAVSPWQAGFGTTQGQIQPSGWQPPEGTYAFCLGSDIPNFTAWLAAGDYIEIAQACTPAAGAKYLRPKLRIRGPTSMPMGAVWTFTIRVDGVARWSHTIAPGRLRDLADVAINVGNIAAGDHTFAFRLELTAIGPPAALYDVELPGVYIDGLLFDLLGTQPQIVNRDPEPTETGVPVDALVSFEITDPGPSGVAPDVNAIQAYIGGELALSGGVFQTGFTGPSSAISAPQADVRRVTIDALQPHAHTSQIPVRVVTTHGLVELDETYVFATEDLTAPTLEEVLATGQKTIRLTFGEPVVQGDGAGAPDALNPANYAIAIVPPATGFQAAVRLAVVGVVAITTAIVELTTDIEQTPGAIYALAVTNVEDLNGNAVDSATTGPFLGFAPVVPQGRRFDLIRMFGDAPIDADGSEELARFVACHQEVTNLLLADVDRFNEILDPDTAPERHVDRMLRSMGNPFTTFTSGLSLNEKRSLAQLLVPIYRSKGTDPGIVNAIRLLMGIEVVITAPWIVQGLGYVTIGGSWVLGTSDLGQRLTFFVHVPQVLTTAQRAQMDAIVKYMRREATHHRFIEPSAPPAVPDHLVLGLSTLGVNWKLH